MGAKKRGESLFSYFDRSARPEMHRIRDLIETWSTRYPEANRSDVVGRLQSKDNNIHISGFLELLLHELFSRAGARFDVHPEMNNIGTHPEFSVTLPGGNSFYVEAKRCDPEARHRGSKSNFDQIANEVDKIINDRFYIWYDHGGSIKRTPILGKIRIKVKDWLSQLDFDAVNAAWRNGDLERHVLEIKIDDARLWFRPIPRSQWEPENALVTMEKTAGGLVTTSHISRAIREKASKYGEFDKPYFIMANLFGLASYRHHIMEALFSRRLSAKSSSFPSDSDVESVMAGYEGVLFNNRGKSWTRVSGVVWTSNLTPYDFAQKVPELIHNPFASIPITEIGLPFATLTAGEEGPVEMLGRSFAEMMDLPEGWPSVE